MLQQTSDYSSPHAFHFV